MAHHFEIGLGLFASVMLCSNFACIRGGGGGGGGSVNPPNAWFSAPAWAAGYLFSKMVTNKRDYLGVKITIMRATMLFSVFP